MSFQQESTPTSALSNKDFSDEQTSRSENGPSQQQKCVLYFFTVEQNVVGFCRYEKLTTMSTLETLFENTNKQMMELQHKTKKQQREKKKSYQPSRRLRLEWIKQCHLHLMSNSFFQKLCIVTFTSKLSTYFFTLISNKKKAELQHKTQKNTNKKEQILFSHISQS